MKYLRDIFEWEKCGIFERYDIFETYGIFEWERYGMYEKYGIQD